MDFLDEEQADTILRLLSMSNMIDDASLSQTAFPIGQDSEDVETPRKRERPLSEDDELPNTQKLPRTERQKQVIFYYEHKTRGRIFSRSEEIIVLSKRPFHPYPVLEFDDGYDFGASTLVTVKCRLGSDRISDHLDARSIASKAANRTSTGTWKIQFKDLYIDCTTYNTVAKTFEKTARFQFYLGQTLLHTTEPFWVVSKNENRTKLIQQLNAPEHLEVIQWTSPYLPCNQKTMLGFFGKRFNQLKITPYYIPDSAPTGGFFLMVAHQSDESLFLEIPPSPEGESGSVFLCKCDECVKNKGFAIRFVSPPENGKCL